MSSRAAQRETLRESVSRHRLFSAHLLDRIVDPTATDKGPMASRLMAGDDLRVAYASMSRGYRTRLEAQLGKQGLEELLALSQENNSSAYLSQLHHLALRLRKLPSQAGPIIWQEIAASGNLLLKSAQELNRFNDFAHQAKLELQVLSGAGPLGMRLEHLGDRFIGDATDPWMLLGFGVAATAYKATRLATLSRLLSAPSSWLSRGSAAGLVASTLGLSVEAPGFVLVTKAGHQLSGTPQDWSSQALQTEFLATGMTLSFLKAGGALSTQAFHRLHGIDPLRPLPLRLPALTKLSRAVLPQAGMLGGIMLGHKVETQLRLRPEIDASHPLADGLVTLLQFNIAGRLSDRLWGPKFHNWQRELDFRQQDLKHRQGTFLQNQIPVLAPFAAIGERLRASRGADPKLQHISLMTKGGDEGEGGKILRLPTPGNRAEENATPESPGPVLDPVEAKRYTQRSLEEGRSLLKEIRRDLYDLIMQSRVYAGHLAARRGWIDEVDRLGKTTGLQLVRVQEQLNQVEAQAKKLEASIFLSHQEPDLLLQVGEVREELQDFRQQLPLFRSMLGRLHQAIHQPERVPVEFCVEDLLRLYSRTFLAVEMFFHENLRQPAKRLLTQVEGMLFGVSLKEVFRGSLLRADSPREFDYGLVSGLLEDLHNRDLGPDLFHVLMARRSGESSPHRIREVLARGGNGEDPFRGWVSVHLPTLIAAHQGNFDKTYKKLQPILPLMSPETRTATHLAGWWLAKALTGIGDPREWSQEYEELAFKTGIPSRPPESKDLVAVRTAIEIFQSSPFDPEIALHRALAAPEVIREDVASLLGALMGGFHGMGHIPQRWVTQTLLATYPDRNPQAIAKRLQTLEIRNRDFSKAFRSIENLWAHEPLAETRRPALYLFYSSNRLHHSEALFVAQEVEILLQQDLARVDGLLQKAESGTLHPSRFREFIAQSGDSLEAWEQLRLKVLRSQVEDPSRLEMWANFRQEIQHVMEHLRALSALLHPYQHRRRPLRLSRADLQSIHDQQVGMNSLLSLPHAPEDTRFVEVGDLVMGEEKMRQKRSNLLSLELLRAQRPGNDANREEISMADQSFPKEVGGWFDPGTHLGKIAAFWAEWAKAAGEPVTDDLAKAFRSRLNLWPAYFRQDLSYYTATNPKLAKVLLVQFGLLPTASKLSQDPEVVAELARKSRDELPDEELQRLTDFLVSNYEWAAASHFRETYNAVSEAEKSDWKQRAGDLPPIVLNALTGGGLGSAQILLYMNRLGFTDVGIPPHSEIPERGD